MESITVRNINISPTLLPFMSQNGKMRCPTCNGTGTEPCEVHGGHKCEKCGGKGCIDRGLGRIPSKSYILQTSSKIIDGDGNEFRTIRS